MPEYRFDCIKTAFATNGNVSLAARFLTEDDQSTITEAVFIPRGGHPKGVAEALCRLADNVEKLAKGQGDIGGTMLPGPEGVWSMPPELLKTLPGYDPDVGKNRAEARKILEKLGYGPDKRLAVTVSTRNVSGYRDAAVILIDQLKEIYIDGQLETVDTTQWYPKIMRKDFTVGLNVSESAVDDPDQQFYENYVCTAERNYTGYCSPEVDQLVDRQSAESDKEKRKRLVWEIERRLAQDGARPVIFYPRQATCWHPHVKGMTMMVNSIYNGFRYEDLWLD